MRTYRFLLLLILLGTYESLLAEAETSLPPSTTSDQDIAVTPLEAASDAAQATDLDESAAAAAAATAAAAVEEDSTEGDSGVVEDDGKEANAGGEEEAPSVQAVGADEASTDDIVADAAASAAASEVHAEGLADALEGEGADGDAEVRLRDPTADAGEDTAAAAAAVRPDVDEGGSGVDASAADDSGGDRDGFVDGWRGRIDGDRAAGDFFKGALRNYDSLLKEHYLKMSFVQATALGVVGDTIAQRLERRWNPGQRFELRRTAHAGILNMLIDGIFTPQWYNAVDYVNDEMTLRAAFVKALAASAIYAPFANGMFLAGARFLRYGPKAHFDWAEWRRQLLVCTVRDFEMWPPLHILNFWLVPKHWRPLVGHVAGVALLAVISSTGLTDAGLPLGQRAVPLALRWARGAAHAIGERMGAKGRRVSGAPEMRG